MPRPVVGFLRSLVVALALLTPLTVTADPGRQPQPTPIVSQPNQILVRFQPDAPAADVARLLAAYPPLSEVTGVYRLSVADASTALADLRAEPSVAYAIREQVVGLRWPGRAARARAGAILAPQAVDNVGAVTATATATATATPTPTATATLPVLATATPTATATGAPAASSTPGATSTATTTATATMTPTAPPPPILSRFWLSDTRFGPVPAGAAEQMGRCNGPRFNANSTVYINVNYENLPEQQLRAQLFSLGFNMRDDEVLGAITSPLVTVKTTGSVAWPLSTLNLPVGCYETRVVSSDPNTRVPIPLRFQIVTAPTEDSFYPRELWQWDHTRAYQGAATADIKATGAWNITTGDSTVVAVISTGADTSHPEFAGRLAPGYDFVYRKPDADDDFGYGTFLTGLIAANARNNASLCGEPCDMVGVNWGAKIMPLKVTALVSTPNGDEWQAPVGAVIEAMAYARTHGARIILVSLPIDANGLEAETERAFRTEISAAAAANILVVAPVGDLNSGAGPDARLLPAGVPGGLPLAVSATDESDRHWEAAYAREYVDLSAPGRTTLYSSNIRNSTWCPGCLDPDYADGDTAVAAAQVAGAAALVWSVNPNLSALQVQAILKTTADKVDTANHPYDDLTDITPRNNWVGAGRLNVEKALWETPHDMRGAFTTPGVTALQAGRQCTRLLNTRTGAVTWTVRVAPGDEDWVSVSGPYSSRGSRVTPDMQGDLPSYADVCVDLGAGANQRPLGAFYKPRLSVRSAMPLATPREMTVEIPVDTMPARLFLPLLQANGQPPTS